VNEDPLKYNVGVVAGIDVVDDMETKGRIGGVGFDMFIEFDIVKGGSGKGEKGICAGNIWGIYAMVS